MVKKIFTIGHSTRTIDEFIGILKNFEISEIVDIRTIPKSRHNPQFNTDNLKKSLENEEIKYQHMELLGGLRHATKNSINTAWKNASFRGFADYMQTPDFEKGISDLVNLSKTETVAIMCAEAVPWRCHRSLVGDALIARKIMVMDIMNVNTANPHELTSWAKVKGTNITYPEEI